MTQVRNLSRVLPYLVEQAKTKSLKQHWTQRKNRLNKIYRPEAYAAAIEANEKLGLDPIKWRKEQRARITAHMSRILGMSRGGAPSRKIKPSMPKLKFLDDE